MRCSITLIAGIFLTSISAVALSEEITTCDLEVAHPSDPDHVGSGKSSGEVVTHKAIPACRAAVEAHPEIPRFHYQLGRAIVYWADANGADVSEGIEHLEHAAEKTTRRHCSCWA